VSQPRPGRPDASRDRDATGRARNARPRDPLGRPLPRDPAAPPPAPDPPPLAPDAALTDAQRLLDAGRPFEAHEVLEAVWKGPDVATAERDLWRGLAQLAVGLTHLRRGNRKGAHALLNRAAGNLAAYSGTLPHSIAVDALHAWARSAATAESPSPPPPLRSAKKAE
jgi:hypothetical protein